MKHNIRILGLSGTNGAGKDTVGELLAQHYGYFFFPLTELMREECRRRGIPVVRQNTGLVANEWRSEFGPAVLVERSMKAFEDAGGFAKYKGFVLSSLRNPYEADRLHELGGSVVWIDAEPRARYDRIQKNAALRGRGGEDNKTFEQFLIEQDAEMYLPKNPTAASMHIAAIKDKSDFFIQNDSDNLTELKNEVSRVFGLPS